MEEEAPPGVPEWVVTYGDMMSLLLTFFIMLVSMSQLKEDGQVKTTLDALVEQFGPDELFRSGVPGNSLSESSNQSEMYSAGMRSEGGIQRASKTAKGLSGPEDPVDRLREGKQITIGGPAMFSKFSAHINPELEAVLETLVEVADSSRKLLAVRGHASPEPLPPGAEFEDHHELAFARAERVAEFLVSKGVASSRVTTSTAGAAEPRVKTRDAMKQRLNDRVDVFLVDAYTTTQ